MSRHRGFCFTLNNYLPEDIINVPAMFGDSIYLIIGREVAPDTGTPHLQGFVYFRNARSFECIRKILPRAHWEIMRGSPKQASDYCRKSDKDPIVVGELPSQGHRSDLDLAAAAFREGRSLGEVLSDYPSLVAKYPKGIVMMANYCRPPPVYGEKRVIWLWGPSGLGKTRYVYTHHAPQDVWRAKFTMEWYDGYDRHPVALFDDFRTNWKGWNFSFFLALLDRYPLDVAVKGGFVPWCPSIIIITTHEPPHFVMTGIRDEDMNQLWRRVTEVKEFSVPVADPIPVSVAALGVAAKRARRCLTIPMDDQNESETD